MGKSDKLSVFISLVLRHKPEAAGISLDEHSCKSGAFRSGRC